MTLRNGPIRILAFLGVLASMVWGYWWLTWGLILMFLFIFPSYYEILFWGVLYDALYGLSSAQFWNFPYVFSVSGIILFLLSLSFRKLLAAYEPI